MDGAGRRTGNGSRGGGGAGTLYAFRVEAQSAQHDGRRPANCGALRRPCGPGMGRGLRLGRRRRRPGRGRRLRLRVVAALASESAGGASAGRGRGGPGGVSVGTGGQMGGRRLWRLGTDAAQEVAAVLLADRQGEQAARRDPEEGVKAAG
jgi:hypothetical protein